LGSLTGTAFRLNASFATLNLSIDIIELIRLV
jgi:hypothetical protein